MVIKIKRQRNSHGVQVFCSLHIMGLLTESTSLGTLFSISSGSLKVQVVEYGAYIVGIQSPNRDGIFGEVAIGYDKLDKYLTDSLYLGCVCGRFANRIAKGKFSIDGKEYTLAVNNGQNALHGGIHGFGTKHWTQISSGETPDGGFVRLHYKSNDGEEGYPGTVNVTVTYTVSSDQLIIHYEATSDKNTVVNLTNHSYFNLSDGWAKLATDHYIRINADAVLSVDETLIPIPGSPTKVDSTYAFDLRELTLIGDKIHEEDKDPQIRIGKGYDHNFCLNMTKARDCSIHLPFCAEVQERVSGRKMEIFTDQVGIQFYSGNYLDGTCIGRNGEPLVRRLGFALETQHFPNSPNRPDYPTTLVKPGDRLTSATIYKFSLI